MGLDAWERFALKDAILSDTFDGIIRATRPDVICDIGSFNGDESARFKIISPASRIYAFEANKQNIENLMHARQDLVGVTIENAAVCDYDGEISFNILEADGPDDWRQGAGSINVRVEDIPASPVTVRSIRLDTYFRGDLGTNRTFALWIDVEGALDRVLAGARSVLSQTILIRAEVERRQYWVDQKLTEEIISTAEQAGFVLVADSYTPELTEQSDLLLLNRHWLQLVVSRRDELDAAAGAK